MTDLVQSRGLVQGVTGDGKKDIEESVVTTEGQEHKVKAVNASSMLTTTFGVYCSVHHLQMFNIKYL